MQTEFLQAPPPKNIGNNHIWLKPKIIKYNRVSNLVIFGFYYWDYF